MLRSGRKWLPASTMALGRKLKVYCTPIGFHDAYVAATSQKAALEAWGAEVNLFARGAAQVVTDPKLIDAPLSQPGVVIRKARGTVAEHIDALPKKKKAPVANAGTTAAAGRTSKPRPPRPSRAAIERAEQALSDAEVRHADEKQALADREKQLVAEKRKLEQAQQKELDRLQRSFDRAKADYQKALHDWEA
jgi:hypothetical protein